MAIQKPRLVVALLFTALAACTSSGSGRAPRVAEGPGPCPRQFGNLHLVGLPGSARMMVPATPTSVDVCGPASRTVISGLALQSLTYDLNSLQHLHKVSDIPCPADVGPQFHLWFHYTSVAVDQEVVVDDQGCALTQNGALLAHTDHAVLADIGTILNGKASG